MKSEIENVITEMKCGKASGNDDIATEKFWMTKTSSKSQNYATLFVTQDIFHLIRVHPFL